MKIGFIGFGNMATAIAKGILNSGIINANDISAFDISEIALKNAADLSICIAADEKQIANSCEYVFLCVKPQSFTVILDKIKDDVSKKTKIVTIAAGITTKNICDILTNASVVRAMPNTPLLIGLGTVALCRNSNVSDSEFCFVKDIFASASNVYELCEDKFNEVICVSGSTPAFLYLITKLTSEFAKEHGIDEKLATDMFCDTMSGVVGMIKQTDYSLDELITMVSSKGGTTVAALDKFTQTGFDKSYKAGLEACLNRAQELSL